MRCLLPLSAVKCLAPTQMANLDAFLKDLCICLICVVKLSDHNFVFDLEQEGGFHLLKNHSVQAQQDGSLVDCPSLLLICLACALLQAATCSQEDGLTHPFRTGFTFIPFGP